MFRNAHHLIDAYSQLQLHADTAVLATIIETQGSTYQKAGARMLINSTGELRGLLGGGCFENDLLEHSRTVFETGSAKTLFYDMRSPEDAVWGLGLGCNGAVSVLLQLLSGGDDYKPLGYIASVNETGRSGILITICESAHSDYPIGENYFLSEEDLNGTYPNNRIPGLIAGMVKQNAKPCQDGIVNLTVDGLQVKLFIDWILPPNQLLVLGAGADALPLVECAKLLGWRITLVDYRPGNILSHRFPKSDALLNAMPEELAQRLRLNRFDATVLMTHNIEYDARYLKVLASSRIPFIGLLGPFHRRNRLLKCLGPEAEKVSSRVFGPVGLDIGAESPEEIAFSIMAGIQAALKERKGGQLSPKNTNVNDAP